MITGSPGEFLPDPMQVSSEISIASTKAMLSNALIAESPEECRQGIILCSVERRKGVTRNIVGREEEAFNCWWK